VSCQNWRIDWLISTPFVSSSPPHPFFSAYRTLNLPFIHQWLYSPLSGPGLFFSFVIFFTQSVVLLGRGFYSSQGLYLYTGEHRHRINARTDIHSFSGIRIHDHSVRGSEDISCLRPRGHRVRQSCHSWIQNLELPCCYYSCKRPFCDLFSLRWDLPFVYIPSLFFYIYISSFVSVTSLSLSSSGLHKQHCGELRRCMNVNCVAGTIQRSEQTYFWCIVSIVWILIICLCGYVKCRLYKGDGLRLNIYAYNSWWMVFNIDLDASFDNM
jgi:hypothetical protein